MARETQQIVHIKAGRRAQESEHLPNNWEEVDINCLAIPKNKAIFFFGGNTTNRSVAGNGNIKIMASYIDEDYKGKTALYSFWYEEEPLRSEGFLSNIYIEEAIKLYEKTFKPILFDDKGNIKEKKGIERALSKIVFGAHCGGSNFVNIIINEMYNTLIQYYPPKTAELLINKIKYFAYAPNETLDHNVNALVIAPSIDPSFSWSKALQVAESQKVDIDYPKGIIKKLAKARQQGCFQKIFSMVFKSARAIMFKVGNTVYIISNQLNPNKNVGDHSIECMRELKCLTPQTDCEKNHVVVSLAVRLFINGFLSQDVIDLKSTFGEIATSAESNSNYGLK